VFKLFACTKFQVLSEDDLKIWCTISRVKASTV
jgi:hypothetical protein